MFNKVFVSLHYKLFYMYFKKTTSVLCFLMVVTFALSSCSNNSNSSSTADSSATQMQPAPDNSGMDDTTITDSASTRPIENPPGKTQH